MNSRTLTYMTGIVIAAIGLLLLANMFSMFESPSVSKYLLRVEIKGVALVKDGKNIALNYNQQNELVNLLNGATPVDKQLFPEKGHPTFFDKIIISRFSQPNVEIIPIKYVGEEMIFSQPEWNPTGWFRDNSHGALYKLMGQFAEISTEMKSSEPQSALPEAKAKLLTENITGISLFNFEKNEQKLNVVNQASVIHYLNNATLIDKGAVIQDLSKTPLDKIIIYRKDDVPLEIVVVAFLDKSVIFYLADWSVNGLYTDNSNGAFKNLLLQYL